jgi:hypothetical protein
VTRPREHRLEAVDLDRLGQMVIESGSERTLAVFIAAVTGQRGKNVDLALGSARMRRATS